MSAPTGGNPPRQTCSRCAAKVFHGYAVSADGAVVCGSCTKAEQPCCRWCLALITQTDDGWTHADGKRRSHAAELRTY